MKEGKHAVKKFKIIEVYSVLMFIATLFMCIGYAQMSGVKLNITGNVETLVQKGVFITQITNTSQIQTASEINYFIHTMFDSKIILENNETSLQTYEITLHNNSNKDYVFIGALTDTADGTFYDNNNIEFYVNGLEQYVTTIVPNQTLKFNITFKYKTDADLSQNILNSKINFRFKEKPIIELSNEDQIYTLNNIYPDYPPQQYEFWVRNYIEEESNFVPLTYSFDIKIDKPLKAKIYDENNEEVTYITNLTGDGKTKEEKKYILKIIWDDSNEEENIKYDSSQYEYKQFSCEIILTAKVDVESEDAKKYLDYLIEKQFKVNINTENYKDSYNIEYVDITNYNYQNEIAIGEDLEITFIKEIPPEVVVTGAESYTYNKPTLVIRNANDDIVITNPSGELIGFEHLGDYEFNGNNYQDTGLPVFNVDNIARNFVISFEIKENKSGKYATLVSCMSEAGSPYPGFVYRVGGDNHLEEYELTSNSLNGKGKAYYTDIATTKKVEIVRINKKLYVRINDGSYILMHDYTNFTDCFDVNVTLGAGLDKSGKAFRYFKGILSNIEFKFLNESASEQIVIPTSDET